MGGRSTGQTDTGCHDPWNVRPRRSAPWVDRVNPSPVASVSGGCADFPAEIRADAPRPPPAVSYRAVWLPPLRGTPGAARPAAHAKPEPRPCSGGLRGRSVGTQCTTGCRRTHQRPPRGLDPCLVSRCTERGRDACAPLGRPCPFPFPPQFTRSCQSAMPAGCTHDG